jgi:hypothetical protein
MKRAPTLLFSLVVLLVILAAPAGGAAPAAPLAPLASVAPTVVSYQGQVKIDGTTHDGPGYFKFAVVDGIGAVQWSNAPMSGDQPNAAVTLTVSKGLFNVLLGDTTLGGMTQPLTSAAFTGAERYLRVWFSSTGSGFTLLTPDRRIAAVPYALRAEKEGNVITVAKSGGDFTSIQAALTSITDASATNGYLIRVAPGVYSERVTMKPYVDIEGSGEAVTKITYPTDKTLVGANDAEARFLTIELAATSNADNCAISNTGASPRLTHMTVIASSSAGGSKGVCNYSSSSPVMTDMTVSVSTGISSSYIHGVLNYQSSPVMSRVKVTASSTIASVNYGIYNSYSSPTMTDVTAAATGGDGAYNYGVFSENSSSPAMAEMTVTATGGDNSVNYGVFNRSGAPSMRNMAASASGGTGSTNHGVDNEGSTADMRQVVARASGGSTAYGVDNYCAASTLDGVTASASGGSSNYGVLASNHTCEVTALPTLINVTATASGGSGEVRGVSLGYSSQAATAAGLVVNASGNSAHNHGLYIYGATVTVNDSAINGSGTDGCGVVVGGGNTFKINNSEISGSADAIKFQDWGTIKVGGSLLDGPAATPGGVTCAGVYDEAYTFYPSTCP